MSRDEYQEGCPGCRPVIVDQKTMQILPQDHPAMIRVNEVYDQLSLPEKQAWHRVTCLNSRDPIDLAICRHMLDKL
jgi:hypothetical protein